MAIMLAATITCCCVLAAQISLTDARHLSGQHAETDAADQARIEAFKRGILDRMGLEHEPHVGHALNTSLAEKRSKLRLYRRSVQELKGRIHDVYEDEDNHLLAKQYNSFKASGKVSGEKLRLHVPVYLPQPDDANRELSVHSASLHLFRMFKQLTDLLDPRTVDQQVRVDVYQLLYSSAKHSHSAQVPRRLLDSRLINVLSRQSWEDFDIKDAVSDWLADPDSNYGLEVTCSSGGQVLHDVIRFARRSRHAPRVTVYTQETQIVGRMRRSVEQPETYDCRQGDGEKRCCRYPMWISFKDIAWDKWVVQPDGYQAYFCDGACPHSYKVAHNFASIKSLINLANPAAAPAPCCTASKLSPLTLLHYNEHGQLIVTVYEDMIVEQCKCA